MKLNDSVVFVFGLPLLFVLASLAWNRLARDYRSGRGARIQTVAFVWALTGVHFGLVLLAAMESTWHFALPKAVALGGGMALAGIGTVACLGAAYAFQSFQRLNFMDDTRLVTEGVYRWSRNPQLVGWTLVLAGVGLVRGSAMVLFLALVGWVGYRLHLPTEEEHLRRVFGDAYETYRCRTHRYFGRPGRQRTEWSHGGAGEQSDAADEGLRVPKPPARN